MIDREGPALPVTRREQLWRLRITMPWLSGWPIIPLSLVSSLALFWRLGAGSLHDWDEAIYAEVSREMVQRSNWLTLHWNDQLWLVKPPLYMWCTGMLYQVFGVSAFSARAVSAFSGVAVIVVTYLIATRIYNRWAGIGAGVVLLASAQFVNSARSGMLDMLLTLCIYLALYAYLRVQVGNERWWYGITVACALALMVKSAAGLITLAILGVALIVQRIPSSSLRSPHLYGALVLGLVLALPWHLLMYAQHPSAFLTQYLGVDVVTRSQVALEGNSGGLLFYAQLLKDLFFPWFFLAPFAWLLALRRSVRIEPQSRVLLVTSFLVLALYTVSATKIRWYILPAYPALAILVAAFLVRSAASRNRTETAALILALLLVAASTLTRGMVILAVATGVIALLGMTLLRTAPFWRAVLAGLVLTALGFQAVRGWYDYRMRPTATLAMDAKRIGSRATPLVVFGSVDLPAIVYYSNRQVVPVAKVRGMDRRLRRFVHQDVIVRRADLPKLRRHDRVRINNLAEGYAYVTVSAH